MSRTPAVALMFEEDGVKTDFEEWITDEEMETSGVHVNQMSDFNDVEVLNETLILKKDPTVTNNPPDVNSLLIPKYIKSFRSNKVLEDIRYSVCVIEVHYQSTNIQKQTTSKGIAYGTGFMVAPFSSSERNYLITCAHCVKDHSTQNADVKVLQIFGSFSPSLHLVEKGDAYFECQVLQIGDYKNTQGDWSILFFESDDNRSNPQFLLPSPIKALQVQSLKTEEIPTQYKLFLMGLSVPSAHNELEDSKKMLNLGFSKEELFNIRKIIPDSQFSASMGWSIYSSKNSRIVSHVINTTKSNSGSPILTCDVSTFWLGNIIKQDASQRSSELKDFIKSQAFDNKVVAIHCSHNGGYNMGCSVLNWFEAYYYEVFIKQKERFSLEHIIEIENEYVKFKEYLLEETEKSLHSSNA